MININLLPEDQKKKPAKAAKVQMPLTGKFAFLSKFSLKTWLIIAGSSAVGGIALLLLLFLFLPTAIFQSRLKEIEERSAAIKKDVELSTRLQKEEDDLKSLVEAMEKVRSQRLLWARLLNDLSDAAPEQIRLTKLYLKEETVKAEPAKKAEPAAQKKPAAAADDKKGDKKEKAAKKEKPEKKKRAKKGTEEKKTIKLLILEGVLASGHDEGVVNGFIVSLKESDYFSSLFSDVSLASVSILPDGKKAVTIRSHLKGK